MSVHKPANLLGAHRSGFRVLDPSMFHASPTPGAFSDPAEYLDFARPMGASETPRFDQRTDTDLLSTAFHDDSPMERERALWEYTDRQGAEAQQEILEFIDKERNEALRIGALWLLQRTAGPATPAALKRYFTADNADMADWSRLLYQETTGDFVGRVVRPVSVREDCTFDQTLPLNISGYALIKLPDGGYTRVMLSPLWFESIMGRVLACTNTSSFSDTLVIEKALKGLHADGSTHYEIFKFGGFSFKLAPYAYEHQYESLSDRPFYPSGTVEEGEAIPVYVPLARVAGTNTEPPTTTAPVETTGEAEGSRTARFRSGGYVTSVRGRYYGWAAANLDAIMTAGHVSPGTVQLSNPTHPVAGPMTNCMLFGTFRGKLSDINGDGRADLNVIDCHGTTDGKHDLHCDGSEAPDPFERWA